jgi:hypothetical protein
VTFENAVDFSKRRQLRNREDPRFRKRGVEQGRGSDGSNCISRKNITETMSAADMQDVGCPEPAAVVAVIE